MKNIVQFSGGKDSTAMLLLLLERGVTVDEIIFCDICGHCAVIIRNFGRNF